MGLPCLTWMLIKCLKYILIILILYSCETPVKNDIVTVYKDTSNFSGTIYVPLTSFGSNGILLNNIVKAALPGTTIVLPNGIFPFDRTIIFLGKEIELKGSGDTRMYFPSGITGFYFARTPESDGRCYISKLKVFGSGIKSGNIDCFSIHCLVNLENIFIKNFSGYGVKTTADLNSAPEHNASFNLYMSVEVAESGGGFYFHGGDANQTNVIHCDVRDSDGYAYWDDSFLGNKFFGSMAHNSKLGHYRADNGNNRTLFSGCYAEQDSPNSIFGGQTIWIGGLIGKEGKGYVLTTPWAKVYSD